MKKDTSTCADEPTAHPMMQTLWTVDRLDAIGRHGTEVLGSPKVIEASVGRAVAFDGQRDALIVEGNPLAGADRFTIEIIFRPEAGGLVEQRFLHIQERGSEDRILIELRASDERQWFLDTFVRQAEASQTLFAERFRHPLGTWHHVALVCDGREIRHYVNGVQEMTGEMPFRPLADGRTALGMRLNRVSWFRGAIAKVRFTQAVLAPTEFLRLSREVPRGHIAGI